MIDFSKVKSLTIPEGVVTQIADAAGNVLWSAAKKVTITLTGSLSTTGNYVEHNGIKYGSAGTFEAAIGDTITVHAGTVPSSATIYLNGTQVSSAISTTTYSYTVKGNTAINGAYEGSGTSVTAKMYITEIPEGQILFTINGTNYFAGEGMTWAEWFVSDYNTTGKTADDVQSISANGTAVELSAVIVGGTAYEVGFSGFKTILDLGTLTASSTTGNGANVSFPSGLPSGYDACTHLIVDGSVYEVTVSSSSWGLNYTPVGDCVVQKIQINAQYNSAFVLFSTAGIYTVKLGIQT